MTRPPRARLSLEPLEDRSLPSVTASVVSGSLLIQGLIARWMYASLYKLHQVAILGYVGVALDTVGRFLSRRTAPRVKLH